MNVVKTASFLLATLSLAFVVTATMERGHAQEPDPFEVLLPAYALDLEIPGSGGTTSRELLGTITAYAEKERCVTLDLTAGEGDAVLELGTDGQPEACSREGALVTFVNGQCFQLATKMVLRPGTQRVLDGFASLPPDEQPANCIPDAEAGFGPFFDIVIPLGWLQEPVGFNDPVIKNFGQFSGGFTAYANGVKCVREETANRTSDVTLRLGHPEQPDVCSQEGAGVFLLDDYCRWYMTEYTLVLDADVRVEELLIAPPGSALPVDCDPATEIQTAMPTPTASPPGVITPPDTGSAGLLH